ncbi:MAG TPA: glycosyltransferase, partial [Casimicrobiaceae bacterium]
LAGCPVVAARKCAAFADLVVHGENGFLADTVDDVARAIETYLSDEATARHYAGAGQALARSFEWSRLAASVEEVLLGAMMPAPCAPLEAKLRVT